MFTRQRQTLTAAQQFCNLRSNPISTGSGTLRAGHLLWRCRVSPTPLSRSYALRIEYRQAETPRVFIDTPDLVRLAEGRRLPMSTSKARHSSAFICPAPANGRPRFASTKRSCPGRHYGPTFSKTG